MQAWQRLSCNRDAKLMLTNKKSTPITQDAIQEPNPGTHLHYGNLRVVRLQSVLVERINFDTNNIKIDYDGVFILSIININILIKNKL